ncbi:MAG: DUF4424 family protein [Campylobacterales bacterium]
MRKIVIALFCVVAGLFANDGFGPIGAGGIIVGKTNDIAMAKEVLDISYDKIKVDYEFVNESDKDITETIVFPLPVYLVGDPELHPSFFGTIPNFKVSVDGKPIKFEAKVIATSFENSNKDITKNLKNIGFSEYQIIAFAYDFDKNMKNYKKLLAKIGINQDEALWYNHVRYEWKQTFKAKQTLKISHEYQPFLGSYNRGYCNYYDDGVLVSSRNDIKSMYCADQETLDRLDRLAKKLPYIGLGEFYAEYILKTANTWKDGIRDFKLIVRKRRADEIVSLCFPGSFKKTSPLTYEVELKNFKPKHDLKIYFGNIDRNSSFEPYKDKVDKPIFKK